MELLPFCYKDISEHLAVSAMFVVDVVVVVFGGFFFSFSYKDRSS